MLEILTGTWLTATLTNWTEAVCLPYFPFDVPLWPSPAEPYAEAGGEVQLNTVHTQSPSVYASLNPFIDNCLGRNIGAVQSHVNG